MVVGEADPVVDGPLLQRAATYDLPRQQPSLELAVAGFKICAICVVHTALLLKLYFHNNK